jgi:hypothetical protein
MFARFAGFAAAENIHALTVSQPKAGQPTYHMCGEVCRVYLVSIPRIEEQPGQNWQTSDIEHLLWDP